ncbi:MAG: hypothetical protein IJL74_00465 [Bacilli bacterium]|nr:hypothetical protein [Bacilli bacterium]
MKIKRIIIGIFATVYLLVAVFLTACLLTYNDYKISVFGDKSFIIVKNDEFEPSYKKGTLIIVKKNKNDDIKVNDEIFFYNTYKNQIAVSFSKVLKTQKVTDTQTTYTITGNYELSSDYVIGKADTAKVINNVGGILAVLESRWGFLLMIVFPISVIFLYEIYAVVKEIVRPEDEGKEKEVNKEEPAGDDDKPVEKSEEEEKPVVVEEKEKEVEKEEVVQTNEEEIQENKVEEQEEKSNENESAE